jgi:hypothetical protein
MNRRSFLQALALGADAWQKTLPQGPIHPLSGRNDYPWPKE